MLPFLELKTRPKSQSHKTFFGVNLHTLFCKLDHFTNASHVCWIVTKRSSLQKRVSKFMLKMLNVIEFYTQARRWKYPLFHSLNGWVVWFSEQNIAKFWHCLGEGLIPSSVFIYYNDFGIDCWYSFLQKTI